MPSSSSKVSVEPVNLAEIDDDRPSEVTWRARATLLQAVERWDRGLWEQLASIITPGPRSKPPVGVLNPGESFHEQVTRRAVDLVKRKTKSNGGYVLYFVDVGCPSAEPDVVSDAWIETIQSKEVSFEHSQIARTPRVFALSVGKRPEEPAKLLEKRGPRMVDKGGRPAKFGWDEFWIEVCRVANTPDGVPDQRELTKHMLDWVAANWIDPPAESTVRAKLAKLCRALEGR